MRLILFSGIFDGVELSEASTNNDCLFQDAKPVDSIRVHSLNVGAGSCHVIECPGQNAAPILYDCGQIERSDPDLSKNEVVSYVQRILDRYSADPIILVSHADRDHYSYIPAIMAERKAATVWFGGRRKDYGRTMQKWLGCQELKQVPVIGGMKDLPKRFSNNAKAIAQLACGDAETFILTVNAGRTKNDQSMVARIQHGEFSLTLTGDAAKATQRSAMANFADIDTTLATGCHHGRDQP